ncbi:hypothetical protein I0C86_41010 [Plantactinospora sp. S1510]|uniref:Uncharacterized protein n=1 Tax=Plantactinospora alkalitolerans TaxID=2789879 RepID=A0ABS0H9S7_9ACTN|nr:hypothetical protein [Plantactinospora alkalitolerans]MBF9135232.1 hypothetical protein [Plantactinospora alkalitolerans]
MHAYRVGGLYNASRTSWNEGTYLRFTAAGPELILFFARPSAKEIADLRRGAPWFAWIDSEHVGLLAFKFGTAIPWSDAPYHPGRESEPVTFDHQGDNHLLLLVLLVDADTGIIRAMRQVTWPPAFAQRVARSIRRMSATPYSERAFDLALNQLYRQWPGTEQLVEERADITCYGGTDEVARGTGPDAAPD